MVMLIWSILAAPAADVGAEGSARLWQIAVWGAVLTGIVLALGIGIVLARRRYLKFRGPVSEAKAKGFGIEQVGSLHDGGQISDEEFRILRRAALDGTHTERHILAHAELGPVLVAQDRRWWLREAPNLYRVARGHEKRLVSVVEKACDL